MITTDYENGAGKGGKNKQDSATRFITEPGPRVSVTFALETESKVPGLTRTQFDALTSKATRNYSNHRPQVSSGRVTYYVLSRTCTTSDSLVTGLTDPPLRISGSDHYGSNGTSNYGLVVL